MFAFSQSTYNIGKGMNPTIFDPDKCMIAVSVVLYSCTTLTSPKPLWKNVGRCKLNKTWKQQNSRKY